MMLLVQRRSGARHASAAFILGAAAALHGADPGELPGLPAETAAKIDAILAPFDSADSPGCALAVVKDGNMVYARARGMADLEHGIPLSPGSVFHLASESKQFTAAAVLLAASLGALCLDDEVRTYVPELPDEDSAITLRHLLYHTSGVRDYGTLWLLAGDDFADSHTAGRTLNLLAGQRQLNFAPGERFCYSNSGYFLLGLALARATGQSLRAFAQERLFGPLGMTHTRFVDQRGELVAGRAEGHVRRPGGGYARAVSNSEVVGARGVVSTIADLARWEGVYHDQVLGAPLTEGLLAPGRLKNGDVLPYAAGLVLEDFNGLLAASHGGVGDGSSAFLLRFPELRLSVICLANCADTETASLAWRAAVACVYGPYRGQAAKLQTPAPPPQFIELADARLRAWAGAYRDPRTRAVWRVSAHGGGLVLDAGHGRSLLRALAPDRFQAPGPGQRMEADFGDGFMRVDIEGQPPSTLHRVDLVLPADVSLGECAGDYHSEEVGVTWTLEVRDGALHFGGPGVPAEPFEPTVRDEFALGAELRVSFTRDLSGRIVSMSAHTDRVWDLRFDRR